MSLLARIDRFLNRTRVTATRFGRDAMGDPRFVFDLRRGRQPGPRATARAIAWLDREEAR